MPAAKLTCPDCDAVLNPAKMPAPGKRVKCPRCANVFTVPDPDEDEDDRPVKKPAAKKAAPAIKKAPAKAAPKPAPKAAPKSSTSDGEDDDKGTYGFKMTEEEEQEAEEKKPKIEYAADTSVKDPRGPATAELLPPSNWMLRHGAGMFFVGLAVFAYGLWPFVFSEYLVDPKIGNFYVKAEVDKRKEHELKKQKAEERGMVYPMPAQIVIETKDVKIDPEAYIEPITLEELEKEHPRAYKFWQDKCDERHATLIKDIIAGVVLAVFGAALAFASVQLQKIENYTWAMASVGICLVTGLGILITAVVIAANMEAPEGEDIFLEQFGFGGAGSGWGIGAIAAGVFTFIKLRDPKVIEAFEYVPED